MSPTLPDFPFSPNYLEIDGHRLHYIDEGPRAAPPVVMLHGNPTWSYYYRRLVRALAVDHRCIVPDHIGMGLSARPPDRAYRHTLGQRASDLERLLERLGIHRDLALVVHDWGGLIGAVYATRHPERVARLVVFNSAAFGLPPGAPMPWPITLCRGRFGPLLVRGLNLFCRAAVRACVTRRLTPPVRRAYLRPYDSWANRRAVLRFVQDIPLGPDDPSHALLREVEDKLHLLRSRPTLICWGLRDFVFGREFLDRWREVMPGAEVHRFEDAGHFVLEDAHEAIIPLVREFLAGPSAAPDPSRSAR